MLGTTTVFAGFNYVDLSFSYIGLVSLLLMKIFTRQIGPPGGKRFINSLTKIADLVANRNKNFKEDRMESLAGVT